MEGSPLMRNKDSLYLFALAALTIAGLFVLLGLGRAIPQELWAFGGLILGGFVGVARQDSTGGASQSVTLPGAISPQINGPAAAVVEGLAGPDAAA